MRMKKTRRRIFSGGRDCTTALLASVDADSQTRKPVARVVHQGGQTYSGIRHTNGGMNGD
jgi:hypothetical protein